MGRNEMRETAGRDFSLAGIQDMLGGTRTQWSIAKSLGYQTEELMLYLVVSYLKPPLKDFNSGE